MTGPVRLVPLLLGGVFVGALMAALCLAYAGPSAGDDTYIYMHYVQHALRGHGYVYNVGEASYGVTSALWTFAMTPVAYVFGNTLQVWKAVSGLLFGLSASVLYVLWRRSGVSVMWSAALACVALLDPHVLRWCGTGMENGLAVALLVLASALAHQAWEGGTRRNLVILGVVLGALPFARPELAIFGGLLGLSTCVAMRERSKLVPLVAAAAITAAGLALAVHAAFGAWVPQTAQAKGIFLAQLEPTYAVKQALKIIVSGAGFAGVALIVLPPRTALARRLRATALATSGLAFLYLAWRNQLVSTRYSAFLCTPVLLAMAYLAAQQLGELAARRRVIGACVAVAVSCAAIAIQVFPITRFSEQRGLSSFWPQLQMRTPSSARIASAEVGLLGFNAQRYVIDTVGLVDRETLAWGVAHGPHRSIEELESLLTHRRATHYLDTYGGEKPLQGSQLKFIPLIESMVERNNMSQGNAAPVRWRLYALERVRPVI